MSSVIISGDTSGAITLAAPAVSGTNTATFPAATGTVALLQTPSFATTVGVGGATPAASGAGITFPSAQSASTDANTLDDYEEGTWTPVFGSVSGSATYTAQTGTYTKIGRQVTVQFALQINVSSSLISDGNVNGLPFTGSNTNYAGGALSAFNGGTFNAYCNILLLTGAATTMQLRGTTSATQAPGTVFSGGSLTSGTLIAGTMTYFTS
jgi:hypothetical protein